MNKCFKYRLYPNKDQEILIQKTFGCCRFIYNTMLAERISAYEKLKDDKDALYSYKYKTEKEYKQEFDFLKEVDSTSLQQSRMHLQTAYKNFFRNPKTGFPKFKSKKFDKKSYTTNCVNNSIRSVSENHIQLPKLGIVRFVEHRKIPEDYKIKAATISQTSSGKYFISILTEYGYEIPNYQINLEKSIGLDYSTPDFYVDNQGRKPDDFEKLYRKSEKLLARE